MASIDPASYLRSLPPFDGLPEPLFAEVARTVDVAFHPAGLPLARAGGEPLRHLYVVRKGSVRLERGGRSLQLIEEGETFGYTSLVSGEASLDVVVDEDLVAYRVPGEVFTRLLQHAPFAAFFAASLGERFRSSLRPVPGGAARADLMLEVQRLVRRPPAGSRRRDGAGGGARHARGGDLVGARRAATPPAILTDRDLRGRVLAEGLGPATPVARVCSRGRSSRSRGATPVYAAWQVLLDAGRPPPRRWCATGRSSGSSPPATSSAALRAGRSSCCAGSRGSADRRVAPRATRRRWRRWSSALVAAAPDAVAIAGLVARLNDALTRRHPPLGGGGARAAAGAVGLDGDRVGGAAGSRRSSPIRTTCSPTHDAGEPRADWYRRSPSGPTPTSRPRGSRRARAATWPGTTTRRSRPGAGASSSASRSRARTTPSSSTSARRRGAGTSRRSPRRSPGGRAQSPLLLHLLAREALEFRPPAPSSLLGSGGASTLDLKLHGVTPVVFLARCQAIEVGSRASGRPSGGSRRRAPPGSWATTRLRSRHRGRSGSSLALRLRLQLRRRSVERTAGEPGGARTALARERSRLQEAFGAIRRLAGGGRVPLSGHGLNAPPTAPRPGWVYPCAVRSIDPIAYLRSVAPFDLLPQPLFDEAAARRRGGVPPGRDAARPAPAATPSASST